MLKRLIYFTIPALLTLTACSDDNNYQPGEPDNPDCMGVYFDESIPTDYIFVPDEDAEITLIMHRKRTENAVDVPLVVTSTLDGVKSPKSVHFDAGSADAQAVIDCSEIPHKQQCRIKVDIPSEYTGTYDATLFNFEAKCILSAWEKANLDGSPVTFYFTEYDYNSNNNPSVIRSTYEPIQSEMEVLPGSGLIRIKNFINSNATITLSITESPYSDYIGKYRVYPEDHFETFIEAYESEVYGDSWYNPWFLLCDIDPVQDDEGNWYELDYAQPVLTRLSDGSQVTVTYPYFLSYSNSYMTEYSYLNPSSSSRRYNSISMPFACTTDDPLPQNFFIFFQWDGESGI